MRKRCSETGKGGAKMRTCPDCHKRTKKYGEPEIISQFSRILDQIIFCDCGWCGVDSVILTRARPKQLRMGI